MAKLTTRSLTSTSVSTDNLNKGSALTISEMDSNFLNLNTDKLETTGTNTYTGDLTVTSATSSAVGSIQLKEAADNGTSKITIKAPTALSGDVTFQLPNCLQDNTWSSMPMLYSAWVQITPSGARFPVSVSSLERLQLLRSQPRLRYCGI